MANPGYLVVSQAAESSELIFGMCIIYTSGNRTDRLLNGNRICVQRILHTNIGNHYGFLFHDLPEENQSCILRNVALLLQTFIRKENMNENQGDGMMDRKIWNRFLYFFLGLIISTVGAAEYNGQLNVGYNGGGAWKAGAAVSQLSPSSRFALEINVGHSSFDPGNAGDARRIFINDNQGGTIKKSGTTWEFSFNLLYRLHAGHLPEFYLFLGPRYAKFTGNFKFIGNNEDFDVTSHHWGMGVGVASFIAISKKIDFLIRGGTDYFQSAALYGHDTTYSPKGEDINPRNDYTYSDADNAVNQPKLNLQLMFGLSYSLGK